MAHAAGSFMHMPMLQTANYKPYPQKPMTMTITCAKRHNSKGNQDRSNRGAGNGPDPQTNVKNQARRSNPGAGNGPDPQTNSAVINSTTKNLQPDIIFATSLSVNEMIGLRLKVELRIDAFTVSSQDDDGMDIVAE